MIHVRFCLVFAQLTLQIPVIAPYAFLRKAEYIDNRPYSVMTVFLIQSRFLTVIISLGKALLDATRLQSLWTACNSSKDHMTHSSSTLSLQRALMKLTQWQS